MACIPVSRGISYGGLIGGRNAFLVQDAEMIAAKIGFVLVPHIIAVEFAGVLQHVQVLILQIGIIQSISLAVFPAALVRQIFAGGIAQIVFRPYAQAAVMVDPIDFLPDPPAIRFAEFRVVRRIAQTRFLVVGSIVFGIRVVTRAVPGPVRIEIRISGESGLLVVEPVLVRVVKNWIDSCLAGIMAAVVRFAVIAAVIVRQALA